MNSKIYLGFAFAVILITITSIVSASILTESFYPSSGTENPQPGTFTQGDINKVSSSDDWIYISNKWPSAFANPDAGAHYMQWNFNPGVSSASVIQTILTFEWTREAGLDGAHIRFWDQGAGAWTGWQDLTMPTPEEDRKEIINLSSYINTVADINNFKIQFQGRDNQLSRSLHDLIQFNVTHNTTQPANCTNGQEKCESTIQYICESNQWVSQGHVPGECGYCDEDSDCGNGYYCDDHRCLPEPNQAPDTNITSVRNIYLSNEKECIWNGTNFLAFVPYNQIIAYGISVDDLGVNTQDNSPQYVWDVLPITGWTNLITYSGNNGDLLVHWRTSQGDWNVQTLEEGLHRVCGRAKDILNLQENPGNGGSVNIWALPNDDCCDVCVDTQSPGLVSNLKHYDEDICPLATQMNISYQGMNDTQLDFAWDPATDVGCAGIDHYKVWAYENGVLMDGYPQETNSEGFTLDITGRDANGKFYYIKVSAVDKTGNEGSQVESQHVLVDWVNPSVTLIPETPDNNIEYPYNWYKDNFTVQVNAADTPSGLCICKYMVETDEMTQDDIDERKAFHLVKNGTENCFCQSTYNFTVPISVGQGLDCPAIGPSVGVDDPMCMLNVSIIDKAGNQFDRYILFSIDYEAPTTTKTIEGNISGFVNLESTFTLTCNDGAGIDCDYINYTYNGTWIQAFGNEVSFHMIGAEGNYTLQWYGVDFLGNKEDTHTQNHYLDNSGPTVNKIIGTPNYTYPNKYGFEDNGFYVTSETLFTFDCDDGNGVDTNRLLIWKDGYLIYNETTLLYTTTFASPKNGEFNLSYKCVDALGNGGQEKRESDYMDNTPPTVEIINPDSQIGCAMLTFDVLARVTDYGSGVKSDGVFVKIDSDEWVQMTSIGNDMWKATFSNLIDAGTHIVEVKANDNVLNQNSVDKSVDFYEDVYWEVAPQNCEVQRSQGKECSFNYRMTLCHGRDSVAVAMHKLCCLTWLNPRLNNGESTVYGTELFKIPSFWYDLNIWTEQLTGWCSSTSETQWNYINLGNFDEETRTGDITLNFTVPILQSGGMCEKMYYAVKIQGEDTTPRVSYFKVDWPSSMVVFTPIGPGYQECGNGNIEEDEQCDGSNLGGASCTTLGKGTGTLKCSNTCRYNTDSCTMNQPPQPPSGGSGSSGGNSSSVYNGCNELWQCTPWATCVNREQFRVCLDNNKCGTTNNKPVERQACETAKAPQQVTNNQNNDEAGSNNNKVTGSFIGANPVIGGLLIFLIAALALVIAVIARRLTVKAQK